MTWKQFWQIIVAVLCVALFFAMVGCKTPAPAVIPPAVHDTNEKEVIVTVDTVYRDRVHYEYRNGDTVIIRDTLFQYKYRWRDRTDTLIVRDSIPVPYEVIKEVPRDRTGWDKFCSKATIAAIILLVLWLIWKIADYIPVLKPYKQIIKTFFGGIRIFKS